MKDYLHNIKEELEDLIEEPEIIQQSSHKTAERIYLWIRNISAGVSTLVFIISFFLHEHQALLRGIAYILGAGAYFAEFAILTDTFSKKIPHKELFMVYCFGPLYILMGLAYLLE